MLTGKNKLIDVQEIVQDILTFTILYIIMYNIGGHIHAKYKYIEF